MCGRIHIFKNHGKKVIQYGYMVGFSEYLNNKNFFHKKVETGVLDEILVEKGLPSEMKAHKFHFSDYPTAKD
jgi:hypothetical protein